MSHPVIVNKAASNTPYFTPAQEPRAGDVVEHGKPTPSLFTPIKIRGVEFPNRLWVSPMCQYSAEDGHLTDWHFSHLGGIISRGPGLTIVEATSVTDIGRITPEDAGLWKDSQIPSFKRIVDFAHSQNQKIGIQLGHAGRKGSAVAPWLDAGAVAVESVGGWPEEVYGPSAIPWNEKFAQPKEFSVAQIHELVEAFVAATKRVLAAGFDALEIHNAHGYLLHQFVSPASNKRTDDYGGSFENRIRLTLEIVDAVRAVIPKDMPLFLRISATDWLEESLPDEPSWRIDETVKLAEILYQHGVDLVDVSSAGNHKDQRLKTGPAYQAHFAEAVKKGLADTPSRGLIVSNVGAINTGRLAQGILDRGQADVVRVGRQFLKNPGLVWQYAEELGVDIRIARQFEWGFAGRGGAGQSI
ncbi:FMN-linked oxidoreductase [Sistotremastrum niveocremeum HHB9708]|uniref:FMN-linked oxidoreductase n=2 Tax=Sistotremastraceae TaxID=3402574 RepID=A0A164VUV8_9AGAM|nr:FMN-linked oxidoreductase [Sistotremastrum niveocremeum HHB9708]KZT43156.1 FMN-linked oxidoreductase [Sistotremastrum suecicum HHB10207 ss-3]